MDVFEEIDKKFDLKKKVNNLSKLLVEKRYFLLGGYVCSAETYFDKYYFRQWKYSLGCDNLEEFKTETGIYYQKSDDIGFSFYPYDEISAIKFLQFAFNIVCYMRGEMQKNKYHDICDETNFFEIFDTRFAYIISKINQKVVEHPKENYYLIVPCNDKTKRCADLQTDVNVAFLFYEYTSSLLKGNIDRKRRILKELSNVYEPMIKTNKKLYPNGPVHDIFDKLGKILNNFNIRHNNSDPKIKEYYKPELDNFTQKEYEEIYDACYDLILNATLLNEYTHKTNVICEKFFKRIEKKEESK